MASERENTSPPTGSSTTSALTCSSNPSYGSASSAPSSTQSARFSSDEAVATTRAPRCFATWIAAEPTPPAPACTSTVAPSATRTCCVSGIHAVRNVRRNDAPSSNDAPSGSGTSSDSSTTTASA